MGFALYNFSSLRDTDRNLKKRMTTILVSNEDSWNSDEYLQLSQSHQTAHPIIFPFQKHPDGHR